MQLVVVIAVANAVSAATITFTAISIKRFFIGYWLRDYTIIGIVVATAAGVVAWSLSALLRAAALLGAALRATALRCAAVAVLVLVLTRELLVEAGAQLGVLTHGRCLVDRLLALVGEEGDPQTSHVLLCAVVLGVSHTLGSQHGIERSDTVELHLVAVGEHLLDTGLQLGDDTDHHVLRVHTTVLHDVLGHVVQVQRATTSGAVRYPYRLLQYVRTS